MGPFDLVGDPLRLAVGLVEDVGLDRTNMGSRHDRAAGAGQGKALGQAHGGIEDFRGRPERRGEDAPGGRCAVG